MHRAGVGRDGALTSIAVPQFRALEHYVARYSEGALIPLGGKKGETDETLEGTACRSPRQC